LRTSKVFVALISPTYIASDYCGKELTIFRERVTRYAEREPKGASTLIIPLMWTRPIDKLPQRLEELQYDHIELPQSYRDEELSVLVDNGRFKDDYDLLVNHLAKQIAIRVSQTKMEDAEEIEMLSVVENVLRPPASRGLRRSEQCLFRLRGSHELGLRRTA